MSFGIMFILQNKYSLELWFFATSGTAYPILLSKEPENPVFCPLYKSGTQECFWIWLLENEVSVPFLGIRSQMSSLQSINRPCYEICAA